MTFSKENFERLKVTVPSFDHAAFYEKNGMMVKRARVGDLIASLLARLGFRKTQGCGCSRRQEKLNQLGFAAQKLILAPFQKNR